MSDTPLTDAAETESAQLAAKEHYPSEGRAGHSNRGWKHARTLERANAELRARVEELEQRILGIKRYALRIQDGVFPAQNLDGIIRITNL